jgi:hypothetical protein
LEVVRDKMLLRKKFRRPKRRSKNALWQALLRLGDSGFLAWLLSGGAMLLPGAPAEMERELRRLKFVRTVSGVLVLRGYRHKKAEPTVYMGPPPGKLLRAAYEEGGWTGLQAVLAMSQLPAKEYALVESLAFGRAGFVIGRCEYGDHWFISDDRRRKDCQRHRKAGQQARWRAWKRRKEREAARRGKPVKGA